MNLLRRKPARLTRPQRRLVLGGSLTLGWIMITALMWGAARTSWVSAGPAAPGAGVLTREFGLLRPVVTVVRQPVTTSGAGVGQPVTTTVDIDPLGITIAVAYAVGLAAALVWAYRYSMKRDRLIGRCDECGYDLRGLTVPRCPECGAAVVT